MLKLTWKVIYHWKLQPYFCLANLYLKQGTYNHGVCHGWLHLYGLTRPVKSANRELQNEKFMPKVGFEPVTFRIRSERAERWAIRADKYRSPKGDRISPDCAVISDLYHLVDVVKCFVVWYILITLNSQQTSKISLTAKRYKYMKKKYATLYDKNKRQNF